MSIRRTLVAVVLVLIFLAGDAVAQVGPAPRPRGNQNNPGDAAAFLGGMMCIVAVSALISIGLLVWMILFVVSDAKKRGMDPTIWVILIIFVGLIGLIVYLCVREPLLSERRRGHYTDDIDDEDPDRLRRSRRLRDRDDRDYDRYGRRDDDY
jgi:Phospholipase_D-nuclease N-terminal